MDLERLTQQVDKFVKQEDTYSCGVAAVATVARLLGRDDLTYAACRTALNPQPKTGTEQEDILAFARREFGDAFVSGGADTYHKGLAIASITHFETRPEGSGHYWVRMPKMRYLIIVRGWMR